MTPNKELPMVTRLKETGVFACSLAALLEANPVKKAQDTIDIYQAWLDGYQSTRSLSKEDISMIPTFLICRGLVGMGWLHTRRETAFAQEITEDVIGLTLHVAQGYVDSDGAEVGAF